MATSSKTGREEVREYTGRTRKRGPTSLMRNKTTGELFLFQSKWWRDIEKGATDAAQEVEDYFFKNPTYNGEKVVGAYVVILDWNLESRQGNLKVKRVY